VCLLAGENLLNKSELKVIEAHHSCSALISRRSLKHSDQGYLKFRLGL
jgi:hypothetical protein